MVAALGQRRKSRGRGGSREGADLKELTRAERLLLMRFVCSFAWADLEVRPQERELVARMIRRLGLDEEEEQQVHEWLESPPPLGSVDPMLVPKAHRMKFLRAVESTVAVDGEVTPEERETLLVFAKLIR
jgi:tellurite resistance protein